MSENKPYKPNLSKSLFQRGLNCHKSLYLHKYHPELCDEISESQETQFQAGIDVGLYAQKLFPNGVFITFENIPEQIEKTMQEINQVTHTLYEPAFNYDNVFSKIDILHKGELGWDMYEVKMGTSLKAEYIDDVAIQYYVLKGAGIDVSKAFVVHINNQYIRNGEIEVDKLFAIKDVTENVKEKQDFVIDEINKMREMLKGDMPGIEIGPQCKCDFGGYCWKHIPEDSVLKLRGKGVNKFELYRKGILRLEEIPLDILNREQRIHVESFLKKNEFIDRDSIKAFLDSLWYPMCFLDFETTFMTPIPMFDSTRPYQKVPFQYSLHYLESENSELKHSEYLAPAGVNPLKEFAEKLLKDVPDNACILVYKESFEKEILNNLKEWFPEYSNKIDMRINNIRDLMKPFKNKDFYDWKMYGSYSLKNVLPSVITNMSYEGMEINEGEKACQAYLRMFCSQNSEEIERIRKALLEYCNLDTLAMVKIVEKLKTLI